MSEPEKRCPKCQAVVLSESAACPICHYEPKPSSSPPVIPNRTPQVRWLVFFLVLLAPAVLTVATARIEEFWPIPVFFLSLVSAIYCGVWLALRVCRTTVARVLTGIAFSGAFYVVSFILCCAGCSLAGVSVNIH